MGDIGWGWVFVAGEIAGACMYALGAYVGWRRAMRLMRRG